MTTKSLEPQPMIIPGTYKGLWSAYYVQVIFDNGNMSDKIQVQDGIRGVNVACNVVVDEDGYIHVK